MIQHDSFPKTWMFILYNLFARIHTLRFQYRKRSLSSKSKWNLKKKSPKNKTQFHTWIWHLEFHVKLNGSVSKFNLHYMPDHIYYPHDVSLCREAAAYSIIQVKNFLQ